MGTRWEQEWLLQLRVQRAPEDASISLLGSERFDNPNLLKALLKAQSPRLTKQCLGFPDLMPEHLIH